MVAHPVWVLLGCLVLTMGMATGLKEFTNNNDPRIFFTEDNPDFKRFVSLEDSFTANEVVLFVVHPKDDNLFTPEALSAVEALTEDAWLLPHATRVDSLANFPSRRRRLLCHYHRAYGGPQFTRKKTVQCN